MMTADDVFRAKLLLEALSSVDDVRSGFKQEASYPMRIKISAFEDEGESGGLEHGRMLLPTDFEEAILTLVEGMLRERLKLLGVSP